jgi:hypothetical protein
MHGASARRLLLYAADQQQLLVVPCPCRLLWLPWGRNLWGRGSLTCETCSIQQLHQPAHQTSKHQQADERGGGTSNDIPTLPALAMLCCQYP